VRGVLVAANGVTVMVAAHLHRCHVRVEVGHAVRMLQVVHAVLVVFVLFVDGRRLEAVVVVVATAGGRVVVARVERVVAARLDIQIAVVIRCDMMQLCVMVIRTDAAL